MESCLLCLELDNESVDTIKVNSIKWQELNVQNLIEKHFWPMEATKFSSWLCARCWKELSEFHKFYVRIEDAHTNLGTIMKIEVPNEFLQLEPDTVIQNALSTELIIEEEKIIIKEELEEDSCEDETPLMVIRENLRKAITISDKTTIEDPLHTSRKRKKTKTSETKKKESKKTETKTFRKEKQTIEQTELEPNSESFQIKPESHKYDDTDSNTDTGSQDKLNHNSRQRKKYKTLEFDKLLAEHLKISCNICNTPMETFRKLVKHVKIEHNQRGYVICCNKKFHAKEILVDHVKHHLDPNYLKCNVCNKIFSSKRILDSHCQVHDTEREKTHCCDICGASFYYGLALENHKSTHLTEEEKMFPCSRCDKKFGNKWFLYSHVRVVHGNTINCDICGLVLSTIYALNKHKTLVHPVGEQIDYKCHICPKISKNRQAHVVHIRETHQRGFDHKCTMCDKAYKRPRSLKETIQYSTWICTKCWQELYDFHKFYARIEEAHKTLKSIMKTELANESHFEQEISIHETLSSAYILEEKKINIKEEQDEDLWEDDTPLIEMSKRRRQTTAKNFDEVVTEDPLNKTIKLQHIKTRASTKTKKKVCYKNAKTTKGIATDDKETVEKSYINHETHLLKTNELNNDQADTDSSYEPDNDTNIVATTTTTTLNNENKSSSLNNSKTNNHINDQFISENFKLTCVICQIPVETFQSLCKHFKKEHKQPGYIICCKKKFYRRSLLVDHVNQHLNPNYFKCDDCGKVAADRLCLRLHRKIHETKREKNHCCDICGKGFVTRKVLNTHKAIHLSEEEKLFPCTECNKNFGNKMQLSNHVRAVHLNLNAKICDICGKSIRCKEVFERHMAEHEGKPLPTVTCDICGLLLANKHGLKRHKDMIHPVGGKQEHICPICSKISPNLKAHKKHIQYKHELGYNHKCTICEKAFKSAQTLTEHMATHTGTVLYTCPWCPKTFNSNANMHSHRKKVHRKEWEEETRKKYSGNLPLHYKSPAVIKVNEECPIPLYMQ